MKGLSYAPGSQYIVVGGKAYTASQVRTKSRSWDKGVLTDLCLTRVLTDPVLSSVACPAVQYFSTIISCSNTIFLKKKIIEHKMRIFIFDTLFV